MYKIHCLNNIAPAGLEALGTNCELTENLAEAEAVLVRSANMHELEVGDNLRAVGRAGAGTNNIPVDEYARRGIVVFNTPGANANGVKELVLCGMLIASRDVIGGVEWTQSIPEGESVAKDVEKGKKAFAGQEIRGKRLGVIGLGAIGSRVANAALDLGMKVYGYDPYLSVNMAWGISRRVVHVPDMAQILSTCDYITIHVPLTDETRGIIGAEQLAKMRDGVVLLNFARGGLVDDDAIGEALASGKVRRYVTDFPNEKTAHMKGCIAIPHLGASTEESEVNCAVMAAEEILDYLENGNIHNSVNYPACEMGECTRGERICVLHENRPGMIGPMTAVFGNHDINIALMSQKARGGYAYVMFDVETEMTPEQVAEIEAIPGVIRVNVLKPRG